MLKVALTGGIASGKSTAADEFRRLGVPVIDADRIAREIVAPGAAGNAALLAEFGEDMFDRYGELDRRRLREHIFTHAAARDRVNRLLHPLIKDRIARELDRLSSPYAIVEIPLLVESGSAADFDRVLLIDIPEELQIERLQRRDLSDRDSADGALAAQATREQRLAIADDVIVNNRDHAALQDAVRNQHRRYLEMAKRFATPPGRPSE